MHEQQNSLSEIPHPCDNWHPMWGTNLQASERVPDLFNTMDPYRCMDVYVMWDSVEKTDE